MFRRSDFRKLELFGGGKKTTKVFKVEYIRTGQIFALKEVEAKDLDKLNEYKEEAVQLSKAQHHPNILQCYGYYFYITSYNSYKLGMICELFNRDSNLEIVYRKREKQHLYWKEDKLIKIAYNIIDTFAYLEHIGICHRDIKPTNLFLTEDYEIKVIDFGESIENYDDEDDEDQMATIRGTPQYLSPILWEAHVILKKKEVEHNMYKSDVFSAGLVLYQLAAMKDVSGFNQKTEQCDGEILIKEGLKKLSNSYSTKITELIRRMLIFNESDRPTFTQLGNYIAGDDYVPRVDRTIFEQIEDADIKSKKDKILDDKLKAHELKMEKIADNQRKSKFINYANKHKLNINTNGETYWFEYGGEAISKFQIKKDIKNNLNFNKWKTLNKNNFSLPMHFALLYVDESYGYFLVGGQEGDNLYQFKDGKIIPKVNMKIQRCFMATISFDRLIFAIGGYDYAERTQTGSIEIYDVVSNEWKSDVLKDLIVPRSQASALLLNSKAIYVFGGYSKTLGTLNSIEHLNLETKENKLIELTMPVSLRRFGMVKLEENKYLILGGITKLSKNSEDTYIVNLKDKNIKKGKELSKGGILEHEIIYEENGNMHLFFENNYGTLPPEHLCLNFFDYVEEEK